MFSSLRCCSLAHCLCYKQAISMPVTLRDHLKHIHSHRLYLFSQASKQNTIPSLLSTPLFLWSFSCSCIVSNVKIQEWPQAHAGVAAFLAKNPELCAVHFQATWGNELDLLYLEWNLIFLSVNILIMFQILPDVRNWKQKEILIYCWGVKTGNEIWLQL